MNIYGTIFFDDEDDDVYTGDLGLEGMPVELKDANDNIIMTTTTDTNGDYAFENLPAGEYCVHYETMLELYPSYVPDSSIPGYVDPTTGEGPDSLPGNIMHHCEITLDPGEDSIENDFGLIESEPVNIYGTIFFDDEDDDVYTGDLGLEGMPVNLEDENGNILMTTHTDSNGDYAFEMLPAGEYCVHYEVNTDLYPDYVADSSIPGYVDPLTGEGIDSLSIRIMRHCTIQLDPGEDSIENDF